MWFSKTVTAATHKLDYNSCYYASQTPNLSQKETKIKGFSVSNLKSKNSE